MTALPGVVPAGKPGRFGHRFDGRAAWSQLTPEQQATIGAAALEVVLCWNGEDAYEEPAYTRPFEAASAAALDALQAAVQDALPDVIALDLLPVPSLLGQVCRLCGCSENDACLVAGACHWAEPDLCSSCVPENEP